MKPRLMHRDRDFDAAQPLPTNAHALTRDLELETLVQAMARTDQWLGRVARTALLSATQTEADDVRYRQAILRDCLDHPDLARGLYAVAAEAIERKRGQWSIFPGRYPRATLYAAVELLEIFVTQFRKLRALADEHADQCESQGFKALFAALKTELSDAYLAKTEHYLKELTFPRGVRLSARVGDGNVGTEYALHKAPARNWLARILGEGPAPLSFSIDPRDEQGSRILSELRDRGIDSVANALAHAADHVLAFFEALRVELAFYVGCLNLHERLVAKGEPVCIPRPLPGAERRYRITDLYDVSLALRVAHRLVGNTIDTAHKNLIVITGANTGGKSTFLRAVGLAQLMMQCGMFVGAVNFEAPMSPALFTHYKREEDPAMEQGKLDEELARASEIVDRLVPNALVLFNESFAATNEREGSEIAWQIVSAFLEGRARVFFVTHLYAFAHRRFTTKAADTLFLRAERRSGGTRTFRLIEGEPLETGYGEDLYRQVFASTDP